MADLDGKKLMINLGHFSKTMMEDQAIMESNGKSVDSFKTSSYGTLALSSPLVFDIMNL